MLIAFAESNPSRFLASMTTIKSLKYENSNQRKFERFVFVGSRAKNEQILSSSDLSLTHPDCLFLCNTKIGDRIVIAKIKTDRNTKKYLHQLGLKSGLAIEVVSKTTTDSIVVAINDRYIGLGSAITQKVIVSLSK